MIDETRDNFDSWVIETYDSLHSLLFDEDGRFDMRKLLSGEMLSYGIVRNWYEKVMALKDIRGEVPQECYDEIREYLRWPVMDNQVTLIRWYASDTNEAEFELEDVEEFAAILLLFGGMEWVRFQEEHGNKVSLSDWLDSCSLLDAYLYVMDFVDRLNEGGKEIPEPLRKIVRFMEPKV